MTQGFGVVAGATSIGLRHQQVLAELRMETALVSRRAGRGLASVLRGLSPTHVALATEGTSDCSARHVGWVARELSAQESVP